MLSLTHWDKQREQLVLVTLATPVYTCLLNVQSSTILVQMSGKSVCKWGISRMKSIAYYLLIVPITVLEFTLSVFIVPVSLLIMFQWVLVEWKHSLQDPAERSDAGSWEREEGEPDDTN